MLTVLEIALFSAAVFGGLTLTAGVLVLLAKFFNDISVDPDALDHH